MELKWFVSGFLKGKYVSKQEGFPEGSVQYKTAMRV